MRAAVVTAIYDQYDSLKPVLPQEGVDVEWICVTDDPGLESDGWNVLYEPRPGVHPNRAAKRPKFFPWEYTGCDLSVWVDASFRIKSSHFVTESLSYAYPIAQFVHPWRDCLFDEAEAVLGLQKYSPAADVQKQAQEYRSREHPQHWGLWATGVIARRHVESVRAMGEIWMEEVNAHTFQDQISHPYAMRMAGLRPGPFPGTHFANDWLSLEASGRH